MQRLKNFAIGSLVLALLVLPSTSSSRNQESSPESSPFRTSRAVGPQGPETPLAKFVKAKKPIPNRYIVVLEDDVVPDNVAPEVKRARIAAIARSHAQTHRGTVDFIYETALKGYAIELPNEAAAIAISNSPRVRWVEEDGYGEWDQAPASPQPSPPWGLDAIDLPMPAPAPDANGRTNGFYGFGADGTGVNAYVLDSGINTAHTEFMTPFASRASIAADCFNFVNCVSGTLTPFFNQQACGTGLPAPGNNDCFGHGTHVAGTIGGNTYGVAKNVNLRSVKVGSSSGPITSAVIAGVNWMTGNHQASPSTPVVANMSLQIPTGQGLEAAVQNAINQGITVVAAAGNNNANANVGAPANVADALTVGAVDWNGIRPSFSNWGPRVDLFAPGVQVISATSGGGVCFSNGTNSASCLLSGTSQAAPHVTGAVAMYLQNRQGQVNCNAFPISGSALNLNANFSTCPDRVSRFIAANANLNKLSGINGPNPATDTSPNRFLWVSAIPTNANPIDNQRFFVWMHYPDFLNRDEADEGGLDHWTQNITGPCGTALNTNNSCTREWRYHTSRAFFVFQFPSLFNSQTGGTTNNTEFVKQCYRTYLRREADAEGLQHWVDDLNTLYGNPASYAGVNHLIDAFITSPEYRRRFGQP
jgi:subtilisin family serine protease